jgi:Outer membrane protein beta-barrel domain
MKTISTIVLLLFLCINLYGQTRYGIKGGVNLNQMKFYWENAPQGFNKTKALTAYGFNAGFFVVMPIESGFSVRTELEFTQKGTNTDFDQDQTLHINYLQLPVSLSYTFLKKLSVEAGPAAALYLSATKGIDVYNKSLEISVLGGLRYEISERVGIQVRYFHGLTNISTVGTLTVEDENGNPREMNHVAKTRTVSIALSYYLK